MYVKYCSVVPIGLCHCPGYLHFHWLFCLKFCAVDRRSASLFNEVRFRGKRNVLVYIISNSFDLLHFISIEIIFRMYWFLKAGIVFVWCSRFNWKLVKCVLCGCMMNLILGRYWVDLNCMNNYKKFQL